MTHLGIGAFDTKQTVLVQLNESEGSSVGFLALNQSSKQKLMKKQSCLEADRWRRMACAFGFLTTFRVQCPFG